MIKIGQVYEYAKVRFTIVAQNSKYNGLWDAKDNKGNINTGWIDNASLKYVQLISDVDNKLPAKPLSYNHKYEELLASIHKEEGFTPIKSVLSCKHGKLCKVCNPKSEPYISNVSDWDLLQDV